MYIKLVTMDLYSYTVLPSHAMKRMLPLDLVSQNALKIYTSVV